MRNILERLSRKIADIAFYESWMIGIIDQPIENAIHWAVCPPIRWIGPRSDKSYFADPFAWPGQPGIVFCEEYSYETQKGHLVKLVLDGTIIRSKALINLPLEGHLSFPFLTTYQNDIYLMPESASAWRLSIFKWRTDETAWQEFATPLTDKAAADAILFRHQDLFWIAYTDIDIDRFDNLNLCYAPALEGPWQAHPANPVKRDISTSRCAGPAFELAGRLFRPAQDCAERYGGAIRIMEILECTPKTYREREVTLLRPLPGENPDGLHTLSPYGDKCLVDGKQMVFSPMLVVKKVARRITRLWKR